MQNLDGLINCILGSAAEESDRKLVICKIPPKNLSELSKSNKDLNKTVVTMICTNNYFG